MLVHVPESAAPGDTFKAKTPSGHIWAFKVPENLPKDRIIKLHLPDLKASKGAATLKSAKGMSLAHAKRHAHSRVAASIAAARAAGHMAYTAGRMLEGEDAAAATFIWDIFVIAGNPELTGDKKGSSFIDASNTFNSPDGIQVDPEGRLWIQSDGAYQNTGNYVNQGNNQMLVADVVTGETRRFMTGPNGCEVTGCAMSPDGRSLFVNIQHPGEPAGDRSNPARPKAISSWPDGAAGGRPRSATVVVTRIDGGRIGT
jgi:secreted PhoX family phosphatase